MKDKERIPAFPEMTLHDYFAGQALAGVLAYYNGHRGDYHTNSTPESTAESCFIFADAMLKEHKKMKKCEWKDGKFYPCDVTIDKPYSGAP